MTVVSAQDLFKIGSANTFRISAEYRHNSDNTTPFDEAEIAYDVYSVAGMWNWAVTPKVAVTLAGRFDSLDLSRSGPFAAGAPYTNADYDRTVQDPSYNAGVVWRATNVDTLRVSAARGLQIPSLATFGAFTLANEFGFPGLYGNPRVAITTIDNYELGYERALPQLAAQVRTRLFYQESDAVQAQGPFKLNVGSSEEKGAEIEASGAFGHGFRWSGNYTWTDVTNSPLAGVNLDLNSADYAATTPEHRGNVSLGWSDPRWSVDGFVRLVSRYYAEDPSPILIPVAAYATVAARVARQFDPGLTVALSGENLLQDQQRQTIGVQVPRIVRVTLTKSW